MKFVNCAACTFLALLISGCARLGVAESQSRVMAEFVGSSPCDALPQQFLEIATSSPCERITWELTLFTNQSTAVPAIFTLVSTYGMQARGGPGFIGGGETVTVQGTWSIAKGTKANPDAVVYELKASQSKKSVAFVKFSDDLLHLLNKDKSLMIGNASWSYTLNRKAGTK